MHVATKGHFYIVKAEYGEKKMKLKEKKWEEEAAAEEAESSLADFYHPNGSLSLSSNV